MSIGGIAHLKEVHRQALYDLAFPTSSGALRKATDALNAAAKFVLESSANLRSKLRNSGIAGSHVSYQFTYDSVAWICRKFPALIEIDWSRFGKLDKLEDLVQLTLHPAEWPPFDEGEVDLREWLLQARSNFAGSTISWLMRQLACKDQRLVSTLYNQARIPLLWDLQQRGASLSFARLKPKEFVFRKNSFRRPADNVAAQILKPLRGIKLVDSKQAQQIIDLATLNLTLRQREVFAFENANPDEVYLAPLGKGVELAVIGIKPEARFNLEASYGYVLLSHGLAIGYGGVSPLFFGGNTGINIFEEFRRGESSFLFVETLRAFRTLFGLSYFVVNPIQFGLENEEGLESGAFWFYYRLGFRPAEKEVAKLAKREFQRWQERKNYKFKKSFLKSIFGSDLILKLDGDSSGHYFAESNLQLLAHKSSELIAETHAEREQALEMLTNGIVQSLELAGQVKINSPEWSALRRMAPTLALLSLRGWTQEDKQSCLALAKSKYMLAEKTYLSQVQQHPHFLRALRRLVQQD